MLYESPSQAVLDFPDNVTTSARGTLIVCEDGANFVNIQCTVELSIAIWGPWGRIDV